MAIVKKKQLKAMQSSELKAKLQEVEIELKRSLLIRDKNTAKKKELRKLRTRILNYLHIAASKVLKTK
ncbi:MAG: hypothetical protein V1722_00840 [Candidatus Micrarchaeota archaeon]